MGIANGKTSFEVGGKNYFLQYDINAIIALEDTYDLSVQQIAEKFVSPERDNYPNETTFNVAVTKFKPPRMGDIRKIFHAGLSSCDETITENGAGVLMDGLGLEEAATICLRAFMSSFPDDSTDNKTDAKGNDSPPANKK